MIPSTSAANPPETAVPPELTFPRAWAWAICWLMFASTILNYMDRQAMSLVGSEIKNEFHLDNAGFGWVMAVFSLTYAVSQIPAGFLVDRWDLKKTYAGSVIWWSIAGIAAAYSPSLGILLFCRSMLGVGESFNWPCALKVTASVLPPKDRSLGNGIFNSGAAVGAVLTPLVVTLLADRYGWRTAFKAVGVVGFFWVAAWLLVLRGELGWRLRTASQRDRRPSHTEGLSLTPIAIIALACLGVVGTLILLSALFYGLPPLWWGVSTLMIGLLIVARVLPEEAFRGSSWLTDLSRVVRLRRFWVLVIVSVSVNVCWHFLVSWLPTYLKDDRKMTFVAGGLLSAIPFVAADIGNLGGGFLSRLISNAGYSISRARTTVMAASSILISMGAWVAIAPNDSVVIILLALMALGAAAFMANYFAFTQEVSSEHTGLIVGILGGLGNLCAAGFLPIAGAVKDRTGGFGPIFVIVGLLPFLGLLVLHLGWRDDPPTTKTLRADSFSD